MSVLASIDWQTRAIAAYEWTKGQALERMRDEVAAHIQGLTGRTIGMEAIWIDYEAQLATLMLDGVLFRFKGQSLVVVRPCIECGIRQLESAPIIDQVDLGYALVGWQPRCQHCPEEDPIGWLECDDTQVRWVGAVSNRSRYRNNDAKGQTLAYAKLH